jgi:hypothetical protein
VKPECDWLLPTFPLAMRCYIASGYCRGSQTPRFSDTHGLGAGFSDTHGLGVAGSQTPTVSVSGFQHGGRTAGLSRPEEPSVEPAIAGFPGSLRASRPIWASSGSAGENGSAGAEAAPHEDAARVDRRRLPIESVVYTKAARAAALPWNQRLEHRAAASTSELDRPAACLNMRPKRRTVSTQFDRFNPSRSRIGAR